VDEAAHSGFLDDERVLAATTSRLANTGGYLRLVSTPKGQRGFFYRPYKAGTAGETPIKVYTLTYHVAPTLITEEFVAKERTRLGPLFEQEYLCQFITSHMAAYPADLGDSCMEDYEVQDL
jgi:hypothetical protein